jgi:hypothetical protein
MRLILKPSDLLAGAAILISVFSLIASHNANKIASEAKDAEFGTNFSVECNFGKERGYLLQDGEKLEAPIDCAVANLSAHPITIVSQSGYMQFGHKNAASSISLSDVQEASVPEGGVELTSFTGTFAVARNVISGCRQGNNMNSTELFECAHEERISEETFFTRILKYDEWPDPQMTITFKTSDKIERKAIVTIPVR